MGRRRPSQRSAAEDGKDAKEQRAAALEHLPTNVLHSIALLLPEPSALAAACRATAALLDQDALLLDWARAWLASSTACRSGYALLQWHRLRCMPTPRLAALLLQWVRVAHSDHFRQAGNSPAAAQQQLDAGCSLAALRVLLPHSEHVLLPYAAQAGHVQLLRELLAAPGLPTTIQLQWKAEDPPEEQHPWRFAALAAACAGHIEAVYVLLSALEASEQCGDAAEVAAFNRRLLEAAVHGGSSRSAACVAALLERCKGHSKTIQLAAADNGRAVSDLLVAAARTGDSEVVAALLALRLARDLRPAFTTALRQQRLELLPLLRPPDMDDVEAAACVCDAVAKTKASLVDLLRWAMLKPAHAQGQQESQSCNAHQARHVAGSWQQPTSVFAALATAGASVVDMLRRPAQWSGNTDGQQQQQQPQQHGHMQGYYHTSSAGSQQQPSTQARQEPALQDSHLGVLQYVDAARLKAAFTQLMLKGRLAELQAVWAAFAGSSDTGQAALAATMLNALSSVAEHKSLSSATEQPCADAVEWVMQHVVPKLNAPAQLGMTGRVQQAAVAALRHGRSALLLVLQSQLETDALASGVEEWGVAERQGRLLEAVRSGDTDAVRAALLLRDGDGQLPASVLHAALRDAGALQCPDTAEEVVRLLAPLVGADTPIRYGVLRAHGGRMLRALCQHSPAVLARLTTPLGAGVGVCERALRAGDTGMAEWLVRCPEQQGGHLSWVCCCACLCHSDSKHGAPPLPCLAELLFRLAAGENSLEAARPGSDDGADMGGGGSGCPAGGRVLSTQCLQRVLESGSPDLLHALLAYMDAYSPLKDVCSHAADCS